MRGCSRLLCIPGTLIGALFFAAGASAATTVVVGSTSGTPTKNICFATCTYLPFNSVSSPEMVVPFDGNVTSYSVNEGSMGNSLQLRVLRPASGGQFTAVATSAAHLTNQTLETIPVSIPVKKGDALALDVGSSGIVFGTSSGSQLTAYYNPPIADGSTAAPTNTDNTSRLLMSAVIEQSTPSTPPGTTPPTITNASLTHKRFRVAKGNTAISAKAPRGTAFKFTLSTAANVQIKIARLVPGLRHGGKCVKPTAALRSSHAKSCMRQVAAGKLTRRDLAKGANTVKFTGRIGSRKLKAGRYSASVTATNTAGTSGAVKLRFRVVRK